jgi:3-hydroxyacyl-[acyl-carrier-protein] dehydratase
LPPAAIVDPATIDTTRVVHDLEGIRRGNPQRHEMEQLSAIVHFDLERRLIIGYKDVRADEFWTRGHMPGSPLLPGVLMCEAAAQLCSFYCHLAGLVSNGFLGFGGLDDVRFRGPVRPGDRLVVVGRGDQLRRRHFTFETQAFVGSQMVYHARIRGVPLGETAGE